MGRHSRFARSADAVAAFRQLSPRNQVHERYQGGYTFVFDAKTKKKVSFEGILVPGAEALRGFYLWDASSSYADPKTGKQKAYKFKESYGVSLTP